MSIGNRIISLREKMHINQRELAIKLGISPSVMNRIESGERPARDEEIKHIADFFNVSTDYLLDRSNTQNPQQTIAAHRTDDPMNELPEEAIKSIEDFKKYIYQKHGIKYD